MQPRSLWFIAGPIGSVILAGSAALSAPSASASSQAALVKELQAGGYVLVMRHASSPSALPDEAAADPDNPRRERQLDETGRDAATAMGRAIRSLHIPIGKVLSSPTYRALETIRLAGLPTPIVAVEIGDGGQGMQSMQTTRSQAASTWLGQRAAEPPPSGSDVLVVTHLPNMTAAFGESAIGVEDGEALVFRPDGKGETQLVGRLKIQDWPSLAAGL